MALRTSLRAGLGALALIAGTAGAFALGGTSAQAAAAPATVLPTHVFAPYFEAYNGDNPVTLSQQSGAKYLIFAFLQTASAGSCTADWNGSTSQPIAQSTFGSDISQIQAAGGNVVPSFGGYSADSTGTDIADSCTNVSAIAGQYEKVITTYNLTRIDLDIEANSLTNSAGITRRDEAVAKVEAWAKTNNRKVQFTYTMPVTPTGLSGPGVNVVKDAKAHGAYIRAVTAMTFDYYIGTTREMATDTETAAQGVFNQLHSIYPTVTTGALWNRIGVIEMEGIDDYGAAETFTQADATTVLNWAKSKGLDEISFWALQRDNGGCPGTKGAGTCSGISQPTWFFSHTFEPYTN